jgi:hypothetical protein
VTPDLFSIRLFCPAPFTLHYKSQKARERSSHLAFHSLFSLSPRRRAAAAAATGVTRSLKTIKPGLQLLVYVIWNYCALLLLLLLLL